MIRLDAINRTLEVHLAGTVTANQLPVTVSYSDKTASTYNGNTQVSVTNDATPVTICDAPAASTVRDIDYINVWNRDTANAIVTIVYNDNTSLYTIVETTLSPGDQLEYTHAQGWRSIDKGGSIKTTIINNVTNTVFPMLGARVATTGNTNIAAPGATIDGVTMVTGDRVLVWQQTTVADNGIYIWNGAAVPMTRAPDMSDWTEVFGRYIFVREGDTFFGETFTTDVPQSGTLGTTAFNISDNFGCHGIINFGDAHTVARAASGLGPRALSLIDSVGVVRIWRYTNGAGAHPAIEMIWGNTDDDVAAAGNNWWDMSVRNTDTLVLRRRTQGVQQDLLTLTGAGSVVLNSAAGTLATNATDGFLYIIGSAGTPTGTPTAFAAGQAPITLDTTNNLFYFYTNGAWRVPSVRLNQILAATGANSINNGDNAQVWNWALTTAVKSAFTFSESAPATGGSGAQFLLDVSTVAASTANPIRIRAQANNILTVSNVGVTTLQGADTGTGSAITLRGGNSSTAATGGAQATLQGGDGATSGGGGSVLVQGGVGGTTGLGGSVTFRGGQGGSTSGNAGQVVISGGTPVDGTGGAVTITGSGGVGTNRAGGSVTISGGGASGTGTPGSISLNAGNLGGAGTPATVSITGGGGNGATTGGAVNITGGSGGTTGIGASVVVTGGPGGTTSGTGGQLTLQTQAGATSSGSGAILIQSGNAVGGNNTAGSVSIQVGTSVGTGAGNNVNIVAGKGGATAVGGDVVVQGGDGGATSGAAGGVTIRGGTPTAGAGGVVTISGTAGVGTNQNGGDITGTAGNATGTGTAGSITLTGGTAAGAGTGGSINLTAGSTTGGTNGSIVLTTTATKALFRNGNFTTAGDAQHGVYVLRTQTTNATPTVMFLDGTGGTARLNIPQNAAWTFDILVTARNTGAAQAGGYRFVGVIRRTTTAGSTTLVGSSKTTIAEDNAAWDVNISADTTNAALQIAVTGAAATTIDWVAVVETAEVHF